MLDKHIDTGQAGQLWVIPYLLESQECRTIDSLGRCSIDATEIIKPSSDGGSKPEEANASGDAAYLDQPRLSEQLAQSQGGSPWYVSLFNKLKG